MSPTQRTLKALRDRGAICQVVEHFNPWAKVRVALFGVIDIVALFPDAIMGVQTCDDSSHSKRRDKILASEKAKAGVRSGGQLQLWSWGQRGARGKRKVWTARVEDFSVCGDRLVAFEREA